MVFRTLVALLMLSFLSSVLPARAQTDPDVSECVIVLHGMGRTKMSMSIMAGRLAKAGFHAVNFGYPSTSHSIEHLAETYIPQAIEQCPQQTRSRIHFVTHSLGGILVRQYLQSHELPQGSRIVMIAPPNRGSDMADRLKDTRAYGWLTGPPGQQLGTGEDAFTSRLRPVNYEIGIIAGEHDGKVAVENTKLDEMSDFLLVDAAHTFIMNNRAVARAAINFLNTGTFVFPKEVA